MRNALLFLLLIKKKKRQNIIHIEVTPSKGIKPRFLQGFFYFGIFCGTFFIYPLKCQCVGLCSTVVCKCKINSLPLIFTVFLRINTENRILFNMSIPSLLFFLHFWSKDLILRPPNPAVPSGGRRQMHMIAHERGYLL